MISSLRDRSKSVFFINPMLVFQEVFWRKLCVVFAFLYFNLQKYTLKKMIMPLTQENDFLIKNLLQCVIETNIYYVYLAPHCCCFSIRKKPLFKSY